MTPRPTKKGKRSTARTDGSDFRRAPAPAAAHAHAQRCARCWLSLLLVLAARVAVACPATLASAISSRALLPVRRGAQAQCPSLR